MLLSDADSVSFPFRGNNDFAEDRIAFAVLLMHCFAVSSRSSKDFSVESMKSKGSSSSSNTTSLKQTHSILAELDIS